MAGHLCFDPACVICGAREPDPRPGPLQPEYKVVVGCTADDLAATLNKHAPMGWRFCNVFDDINKFGRLIVVMERMTG